MSGPNARYALADDDRAPADRRVPEAAIPATTIAPINPPTAPGDAVTEAGQPPRDETKPRDALLGLIFLEERIDGLLAEINETHREFKGARNERARRIMRGILISCGRRLAAAADAYASALDTKRP